MSRNENKFTSEQYPQSANPGPSEKSVTSMLSVLLLQLQSILTSILSFPGVTAIPKEGVEASDVHYSKPGSYVGLGVGLQMLLNELSNFTHGPMSVRLDDLFRASYGGRHESTKATLPAQSIKNSMGFAYLHAVGNIIEHLLLPPNDAEITTTNGVKNACAPGYVLLIDLKHAGKDKTSEEFLESVGYGDGGWTELLDNDVPLNGSKFAAVSNLGSQHLSELFINGAIVATDVAKIETDVPSNEQCNIAIKTLAFSDGKNLRTVIETPNGSTRTYHRDDGQGLAVGEIEIYEGLHTWVDDAHGYRLEGFTRTVEVLPIYTEEQIASFVAGGELPEVPTSNGVPLDTSHDSQLNSLDKPEENSGVPGESLN